MPNPLHVPHSCNAHLFPNTPLQCPSPVPCPLPPPACLEASQGIFSLSKCQTHIPAFLLLSASLSDCRCAISVCMQNELLNTQRASKSGPALMLSVVFFHAFSFFLVIFPQPRECITILSCLADACASSQECSAIGTAAGICIFPTPTGAPCRSDIQGACFMHVLVFEPVLSASVCAHLCLCGYACA